MRATWPHAARERLRRQIPAAAELFVANSGMSMRFRRRRSARVSTSSTASRADARAADWRLGRSAAAAGRSMEAVGPNNCPPVAQADGLPGGAPLPIRRRRFEPVQRPVDGGAVRSAADHAGRFGNARLDPLRRHDDQGDGVVRPRQPRRAITPKSRCPMAEGIGVSTTPSSAPDARGERHCHRGDHRRAVTVEGLSRKSLQGESSSATVWPKMGAMSSTDQIPSRSREQTSRDRRRHERHQRHGADLSVVALFAEGPTRMRNVAHIRHKETDRTPPRANYELGASVEEFDDLEVTPAACTRGDRHYNDHRPAMPPSPACERGACI